MCSIVNLQKKPIAMVITTSSWRRPGFQRLSDRAPPCKGSRPGPASESPGDLQRREAAREVAPKGILSIFSRSLNLASTCARFPARTRLETLPAAAWLRMRTVPSLSAAAGLKNKGPACHAGQRHTNKLRYRREN